MTRISLHCPGNCCGACHTNRANSFLAGTVAPTVDDLTERSTTIHAAANYGWYKDEAGIRERYHQYIRPS